MKKVTQIPVDKDSGDWVMAATRFEYFNGECLISLISQYCSSSMDFYMTANDPHCLDRLRCAELEQEGSMLDFRLTYTVRVLEEGDIDPAAKLFLVLFTDQKVLGRVKVKIPYQSTDRSDDEPLTGHIDFVPARDQAASRRRGRF